MTMISIYESPGILAYFCVVALALGTALGSFLNCAAWRISRRESFIRGRSRCPACGHLLAPVDLIPVASWLLLRGRCRYCGGKVSPRYMWTELCFGLLTTLCLLHFDLTVLCLRNEIFLCCLFCLSLVDMEIMEIPDGCLIVSVLAWLTALPFLWQGWTAVAVSLGSAVIYGGGLLGMSLVMDRIMKKESLGGGDIKLFAVVGLYLGFTGALFALLLSCMMGLLLAALLRAGRGRSFPFGPAIAAASAVMLFWGERLSGWYLGLFR